MCGEMYADRDALAEIMRRVIAVEQRVLEEDLEEEDQGNETSSDEGTENAEGAEAGPGADSDTMPLRSGKSVTRDPRKGKKPHGPRQRQSVFQNKGESKMQGTKRKEVNFKDSPVHPELSIPLIVGPKHEPVYRAYKVGNGINGQAGIGQCLVASHPNSKRLIRTNL